MTSHTNLAGDRRDVTLREVAEQAGVSRATVSLVLRSSPLVADATRARVQSAIAAVGYVYNRGAARLRSGMSGTIGLIVPEITNPFYAELTSGIDEALDIEGRLTFLANSKDSPERQDRLIQRIREQGVDGIILCAAEGSSPSLLRHLRTWRMAFVQILRFIDGVEGDYVAPDFGGGTRAAIDHLVSTGHRRIALMPSSRNTSAAQERIGGFIAAMRHHGLGPGGIAPCPGRSEATAVAGALLDRPNPPSAVVCHNDSMALGVLGELRRRGLVPGRDVSVVGFDDIPEAASSIPGLTTVATAPKEVGVRAAGLLLRRIAAPDEPPERIRVPTTLIVRGT